MIGCDLLDETNYVSAIDPANQAHMFKVPVNDLNDVDDVVTIMEEVQVNANSQTIITDTMEKIGSLMNAQPKRLCRGCRELINYDSHNCLVKK
ncbi:hypothetical protein L6452_13469 [Arctium lappa]|uniref:Uncharacterized protein n=1 Tax=Arctium lappa TaxID=4217 RepID=A0ACB9CI80_ARCLA|nr:hypothetical protein L6452_13469 [Arctium lappa]